MIGGDKVTAEELWDTQEPDDAIPSKERQADLEAAYQANISAGRSPYQDVAIETLGELLWVIEARNWLGDLFEDTSEGKDTANLSGANLSYTNLSGVALWNADLSNAQLLGTNLSGADLSAADLSGANLDTANLSGANIMKANLSSAALGEANLSGADMRVCRFDITTSLVETNLDTTTCVADVIWNGVPLTRVAWDAVSTLGDESKAREQLREGDKRKAPMTRTEEYASAARAYRQLATALRAQGLNENADHYAFRGQLMQRKVFQQKKQWSSFIFSWFLFLVSGYGYRLKRILITYAAAVLCFALLYWALGVHSAPHESGIQALWDSLLVSLSAIHGRTTFEQLGAWSPAAWAAAVESVFGIVIEGVFVAMLIQRFFAR